MVRHFKFSFICVMTSLLCACSKDGTKEFFFGEAGGPNPFSIGTTLEPLDTSFDNDTLPEPQAPLPVHQQPSRAKKAGEILGIIPSDTARTKNNKQINNHQKSAQQQSAVSFIEFDRQMNDVYEQQSSKGYLLEGFLSDEKPIDPTTVKQD